MKKIYFLILLLPFLTYSAFAQNRTITGTVTSADKNEPLIGVTVQVKGSSVGTQTDVNGKFSIKVTNLQNVVLSIRYVGFAFQEHSLKPGETTLNIKMQPSNESNLSDVVVVGYGTQKKAHLTGAVATVNLQTLQDIPTTNLSSALRGQLPNVTVSGGQGRPGDDASISIRNPKFGTGVTSSTQPLYIIDDAFRTAADFNLLDQTEVESISVLKDAAAAIYGIQGANGVIIVKTKRGKAGTPKVNYSGSIGFSDATMLPNMMTGIQQATYLNDLYQAQNNYQLDEFGINKVTGAKIPNYYTPDELAYFADPNNNTNWLRKAWQVSTVQRHAVDVSGGSDKATYFAGASYVKQNSNFEGVDADRWTFRASTDARVANGLKVGLSVSGAVNENTKYFFKQSGESADDDVNTLSKVPQWQQFYINGNPVLLTPTFSAAKDNINFFEIQKSNNYNLSRTYVLNINANVKYDVPFIKGLSLTGTYNKNYNNFFGKQFGTYFNFYQYSGQGTNRHIPGGDLVNVQRISNGDRIRLNPTFANNYQLDGIINYNRKFGKHELSILALYEQSESYSEGLSALQDNIYVGGLDNFNFAYGNKEVNQVGLLREYGRLAYATRINYNYANKYLLEFAFRADANTNFAPGKEWGYFPSGSLGWIVSEESFFKRGVKFIDYFKVRGSVGLLGNDNTSPFQYQRNYSFAIGHAAVFGQPTGDRGTTVEPNILLANEKARWDNNLKTNLGFDFQFLNNRLSATIDGYFEHRYNLLTSLSGSVPFLIGARLPTENYLSINTFGYEISLGWKDKIGKDFTYNFNPFFSWSDAKNIIIDQPLGLNGTYLDLNGRSDDPGKLGYHYLGMIRTTEQADAIKNSMAAAAGIKPEDVRILGQIPAPGMLYYQDVRGPRDANGQYAAPDGKINDEDQDYLTHKASNHYNLGLNFGGSYKSLSLNVIMGMSFGGIATVESDAMSTATATSNRPAFWSDHWTPTNPDAKYPNPYYSMVNNVSSEFWFRSSFTFRVSNLNLSYAVPSKIANKLGVGSIRAYFNGTNLFNFSNPFSEYRDNTTAYNLYPALKTYSFGLNVGF
ncbi:TonB-dependent receptor [Mucilaginibacter sp. Bleaf8]|uniref:SusC/RagA family TonB-linked outer membrane protein n=1 Tax=Mucilaginibacter sp. Bleaf8 TaxID=2834430 RepID=UPI001BCAFB55|nr:TonB-dependent receptor [Mucilaginibacter sp. Bleaf8]MBS7564895.1 TonB-dependent receptor [Mucilaginibacter sp. Bleaf8]